MGADDEGGDSSGNSGSHLRDAPTWALPARRVTCPSAATAATQRKPHAAADRDSRPVRNVLAPVTPQPPARSSSAVPAAVPATMGRQASTKKIGDASLAVDKENAAALNAVARGDTSWQSNIAKWREHDGASPRTRTPRGKSKRQSQWHLQPHHRYDRDVASSPASALVSSEHRDKSPGEQSRSGLRTPQPAEEPDAESPLAAAVALDMASLVAAAPPPPSLLTQTKRLMERAPLLRPLSSIANDPEWAFRDAIEGAPDARAEFWSLTSLSYPVICTYVLEFLPGIVSMTIVGHLDSPLTKEFVDGVSLSTMFMNLTGVAFGFGLATAMDTLCAQAYGAGKPMKLGIYLQSGFIVLGVTVVPVFLLNWYTETFLLWMGQPPDVARLAGRFSRLILPGIPFLYAYELFKKLLQAQNVVLPMVFIAVLSNVVNIALGVYLAFYTSWGYDGAAVARTVANVVLPASLIPFFLWRPDVLQQWWPGWRLAQALQHIRTFLTLGIPGMFMMLLEWWSFEIMAAFVGLLPHSVVAISVHSVLVSVSTMAFNVFLGIAVATNVRVGNYVGSNQPAHAKLASSLGMGLSLAVSAALAVVIVAARHVLPRVFINDATSVALAAHALLFLMPYQLLDAVNSVMQGVFRGTGRNVLGAYINLFAYFVIGLPLGLYLAFPLALGVEGLWLGLTAGIFGGCLVSVYKIYATDWDDMADAARVRTS